MDKEELNYQFILMRHIDRLSQVCTGYMVGNSGNTTIDIYNPKPISDDALMYGTKFLFAIIPETLRDDEFHTEVKTLGKSFDEKCERIKQKDPENYMDRIRSVRSNYDFSTLRASINLLDRKGLLLPHKIQSTATHPKDKSKKKNLVEMKEVWEDADS